MGSHDGGYSTFRWDVTDLLQEENGLTVHVDNSRNDRVYPQKADFTFYGGIYRDVLLVIVNKDHFDMDYCGGPGLKVTPGVDGKDGRVRVEAFHQVEGAQVKVKLLDAGGKTVAVGTGTDITLAVANVHLWDGVKDPYLYTCEAELVVDGTAVDLVSTRFGVRTFSVDPKKGFFLNGRPYPLHGVSRHQDWKGIGNALTKKHHDEDMAMIRWPTTSTTSIFTTCATSTAWWSGRKSPTSPSICPTAGTTPSPRPRSWWSRTTTTPALWCGACPTRSPSPPRTRRICWTTTGCSTTCTTSWTPPA